MSSSEDIDDHEDRELNDAERTVIRAELSSLSFEELQKLKERIGAKVYKEALFGKNEKNKSDEKPKIFKRENKNRPREMSSKKPAPLLLDAMKKKNKEIRDPRFDPLCGEFSKKQFNEDYNFLSEIRIKDIKAIKAELKQTTDPDKVQKLRRLLQRLNDQHKDNKKKTLEKSKMESEKKDLVQEFKEGKQPYFKNKSERRVEELVKQYEDLKKDGNGRIQKHLKRRQKKIKKHSYKAPTGAI